VTFLFAQSLAIPAIVGGGDYLLAAQTGSGKTLAYLLPIIHMIKAREREPGMERRGKRPKVVLLAPTKELVEQVRPGHCRMAARAAAPAAVAAAATAESPLPEAAEAQE
jgi:superfamily II DNA/RNA helicase